jgi:hypothetical protein
MKIRRFLAFVFPVVLCSTTSALSTPRVEPDRLTPADAELLVTINVRKILGTSAIRKHALDSLKLLLQRRDGETQRFLRAAGLDPLHDIDTISLSATGNPAKTGKLLIVVRGRFDPDKAKSAANEYIKKHPGRVKELVQGKLPIWEISADRGAKPLVASFAGKNALVFTTSKEDTVAVVGRADQDPQPLNKEMRDALDHLRGDTGAWLAMTASDQLKKSLKGEGKEQILVDSLRSITGALEVTDDIQLTLTAHTENPTAAKQIKNKLSDMMQLFAFMSADKDAVSSIIREVLEKGKLELTNNDVSACFTLTDAQLEKLEKK